MRSQFGPAQFPFDTAPRYLIRDRDSAYGEKVALLPAEPGHRGSGNGTAVALAKSVRGKDDRHAAA